MNSGITSRTYFFTLTLIYYAQIFALIVFSAVTLILDSPSADATENNLIQVFQFAVPIGTVVLLSSGYFIFKTVVSKIERSSHLKSKLPKYQSAVIVRAAMIEVAGLLGTIAAFLTGEMYFLAATALIVIVLILLRPSVHGVVEDLSLTPEEKSKLENPNEIVAEQTMRKF